MFGVEKDATHSFSISDVVFRIGPRINAAGRLESGLSAVDLLVTDDAKLCEEYASKLSVLNTARGELDVEMTAEAFQQIDKDPDYPNKHTTVVYQPHWHKGVVGIVASRLIERYYRPTLVLTDADDLIGGSARSIEAVDVHEALTACESLLVQFGGHRHAAGLKLKKENLLEFSQMFEQAVASKITAKDLHPVFAYESELDLSEINERIIQVIQRFAPFGPQNMEPVFMAKGVYDSGYAKTMGSKHEHLRLNLMSSANSDPISAIAFKMGDWYPKIKYNQRFDILYTIGINHFNGEKRMQLEIKDIRHPQ
jgi:single-stranded-DNA-specific exonuclease